MQIDSIHTALNINIEYLLLYICFCLTFTSKLLPFILLYIMYLIGVVMLYYACKCIVEYSTDRGINNICDFFQNAFKSIHLATIF